MGLWDAMKGSSKGRERGPAPEARLEATVSGRVQGVGFRYWTMGLAREHGLVGYAENLPDGSVEIVAEGSRDGVEHLLSALGSGDTAGSVSGLDHAYADPTGEFSDFGVR
ncbi:acylphosphatase [Rothia sp. AR01]|uniref:acylphosphatase n=1 Tax=Rothia santali TaxID=2949643 RepID=A0A9X2KI02_9MICC|nr:acylphosphatase [Rothia santali]MCP3425334.1 acylphosphatase [Rothia santali]